MLRTLAFLLICLPSLIWAVDYNKMQIERRIKPYGQVRVDGKIQEDDAKAALEIEAEDIPLGKKVYDDYCATCHHRGLAGAPIYRQEAAWNKLLEKQSIDALTASAIKGINAMPAMGTCNTCSEEDIRAAVEYMLPQK